MSTTVTFAGNLTGDTKLAYTREGKPYASFRVMVNHRYQNIQGEWHEEEPTPHDVRVYGVAVNNVADCFGSGDGVIVQGRQKTEVWSDKESGEKRTRRVVEVNDYFGFVGAWVKWVAVRVEQPRRSSAPQAV
jgi:single-strand DNA-binding protein